MPLRPLSIKKDVVKEEIEYKWYIINTFTAMENKVKKNIEIRAKNLDIGTKIVQVLVPTEENTIIVEKNGIRERRTQRSKMFPGYLLVYMKLDQDTYQCVRDTTGVSCFVTAVDNPEVKVSDKFVPITLTEDEIEKILNQVQGPIKELNLDYETGSLVQIIGGPMDGVQGLVKRVNTGNGTLNLYTEIMGSKGEIQVPASSVERI